MSAAPAPSSRPLFSHRARRNGRVLVELHGVEHPGGSVAVEARVFPDDPGALPLRRPLSFASREQALRFLDETLTALEYLGCAVGTDAGSPEPERAAAASGLDTRLGPGEDEPPGSRLGPGGDEPPGSRLGPGGGESMGRHYLL